MPDSYLILQGRAQSPPAQAVPRACPSQLDDPLPSHPLPSPTRPSPGGPTGGAASGISETTVAAPALGPIEQSLEPHAFPGGDRSRRLKGGWIRPPPKKSTRPRRTVPVAERQEMAAGVHATRGPEAMLARAIPTAEHQNASGQPGMAPVAETPPESQRAPVKSSQAREASSAAGDRGMASRPGRLALPRNKIRYSNRNGSRRTVRS